MVKLKLRLSALAAAAVLMSAAPPPPAPKHFDDAVRLTWFGDRPAFSPDGKKIAMIGKTFGDAYEIEIATGKVRNLTAHTPHQGLLRVQYLPNGDYLIIAPRHYEGDKSRWDGELWVLDKNGERGLMSLDQKIFEGVAVSRRSNLIGFAVYAGEMTPKTMTQPEFFTAEIAFDADGRPKLANKRRINVTGCVGEAQDFRNNDTEMTLACYGLSPTGGALSSVRGVELATGKMTIFRNAPNEYAEPEGIAPDGSWTAVECAPAIKTGVPALDICRLELKPNGQFSRLLQVTAPGSTRKVNNPVISPDGKWMAVASSDSRYEIGTGDGVLLLKIADQAAAGPLASRSARPALSSGSLNKYP